MTPANAAPAPAPAPVDAVGDADAAPAIALTGMVKSFRGAGGPVVAVDGIDLVIDRGEVVALLGPNGAGKTTTLDVVLGLTEPTAGTARVLGQRPRHAVTAGRVSAVLQTGGLLADLTVGETVRYVASTFGPAGLKAIDEVLEQAGIGDLAGRRVSKCSGGEQQRLRFALALLPDPELLVLDEPTAGMDVTARREFWATMHAEASRGRTVVFATHHLEEADHFADRIVMMSAGRVVADGPTAEIRVRATGRTVSAEVADPDAVRRRLEPLGAEVEVAGKRVEIRSSHSDQVARILLTELGGTGLEITSGSLDDAFVSLTSPDPISPDPTYPENGADR